MNLNREAIAARVDALAEDRATFQDEVRRFADELGDRDREVLGEILLERAQNDGVFAEAYERRVGARGWLRRQWEKAAGPPQA